MRILIDEPMRALAIRGASGLTGSPVRATRACTVQNSDACGQLFGDNMITCGSAPTARKF